MPKGVYERKPIQSVRQRLSKAIQRAERLESQLDAVEKLVENLRLEETKIRDAANEKN